MRRRLNKKVIVILLVFFGALASGLINYYYFDVQSFITPKLVAGFNGALATLYFSLYILECKRREKEKKCLELRLEDVQQDRHTAWVRCNELHEMCNELKIKKAKSNVRKRKT